MSFGVFGLNKPRGSKDPNIMILGPKNHYRSSLRGPIPPYLGTWTLLAGLLQEDTGNPKLRKALNHRITATPVQSTIK